MNGADIGVLAAVAALIGLAVFLAVRRKKRSCCGSCEQCAGCEKGMRQKKE